MTFTGAWPGGLRTKSGGSPEASGPSESPKARLRSGPQAFHRPSRLPTGAQEPAPPRSAPARQRCRLTALVSARRWARSSRHTARTRDMSALHLSRRTNSRARPRLRTSPRLGRMRGTTRLRTSPRSGVEWGDTAPAHVAATRGGGGGVGAPRLRREDQRGTRERPGSALPAGVGRGSSYPEGRAWVGGGPGPVLWEPPRLKRAVSGWSLGSGVCWRALHCDAGGVFILRASGP